jgi:hypothetical protein
LLYFLVERRENKMKRGKKIALVAILAIVAVFGTIGGVALAQSGDEETTTPPEAERFAYLEKVCEIYQEKTGVAIDVDTLKDSLCQAGEEQREQIRNQIRQRLIDEGILTEEELAEWDAWMQSKPDFDLPEGLGLGLRHQMGHRLNGGFGGFGPGLCQPGDGNGTD